MPQCWAQALASLAACKWHCQVPTSPLSIPAIMFDAVMCTCRQYEYLSVQNALTVTDWSHSAYAAYYTSFPAVAIVVYFLRTRHGYQSLPQAIHERYALPYNRLDSVKHRLLFAITLNLPSTSLHAAIILMQYLGALLSR